MINRLYYPLSEAIKTLKGWGTNISINDLLHYGVQGKVRFFIHVPSGIRVDRIPAHPQHINDRQPNLLILSPSHCGEIECNQSTSQSDFPSAYADLYSVVENPLCVRNLQNPDSFYWRTIDSDKKALPIPITKQAICIRHSELAQLDQLIDSTDKPPVEFSPIIDEQLQNEINRLCYSFEQATIEAKKKINGFSDNDLLRYGYWGKLTFITPRPANVNINTVAARHSDILQSFNRDLPDMLALDPQSCYQIEIFGQIKLWEFKSGFLCKFRTLIPFPPSAKWDWTYEVLPSTNSLYLENYRLRVDAKNENNALWRTYHGSNAFPIAIQKENLYVLRSEFDSMIHVASKTHDPTQYEFEYTPEFTISDITKYILSPKNFATLSDAAKIAKCSEIQLLEYGSQGSIEFFTPVPCEIALCQAKEAIESLEILRKSQTSLVTLVESTPQVLALNKDDCNTLANNGRLKRGEFATGYSIAGNKLILRNPVYGIPWQLDFSFKNEDHPPAIFYKETPPGVWLTFYQNTPIEIDVTYDRIFVELNHFNLAISTLKINASIGDHCSDEIHDPSSESEGSGDHELNAVENSDESQDDHTEAVTQQTAKFAPDKIVTYAQIMEMANLSRSTVNNKIRRSEKFNDNEFPKRHKNPINKRVHFLKSEFDAWLIKNPPRDRN